MDYITSYEYDTNNNLILKDYSKSEGQLVSREVSTYHEKNLRLTKEVQNSQGVVTSITYYTWVELIPIVF